MDSLGSSERRIKKSECQGIKLKNYSKKPLLTASTAYLSRNICRI